MNMYVFNITLADTSYHELEIVPFGGQNRNASAIRYLYFKSRGNLALTYKLGLENYEDNIPVGSCFESPAGVNLTSGFQLYVKGTTADVVEGHYVM